MNTNQSSDSCPVSNSVAMGPTYFCPRPIRNFWHTNDTLSDEDEAKAREEAQRNIDSTQASRSGMLKADKRRITDGIRKGIENDYLKRQFRKNIMRDLDDLSDEKLDILRTPGLSATPHINSNKQDYWALDEVTINRKFPEVNPNSPFYLGARKLPFYDPGLKIPGVNGFFEKTQPNIIERYGPPFLTGVVSTRNWNGENNIVPEKLVNINVNFFSAFVEEIAVLAIAWSSFDLKAGSIFTIPLLTVTF